MTTTCDFTWRDLACAGPAGHATHLLAADPARLAAIDAAAALGEAWDAALGALAPGSGLDLRKACGSEKYQALRPVTTEPGLWRYDTGATPVEALRAMTASAGSEDVPRCVACRRPLDPPDAVTCGGCSADQSYP